MNDSLCSITLFSQNKNSLKKLFTFLYKKNKNIKTISLKTKKNHFSILKSPHVNKKAQEQFGFKFFSKKLNIHFSTTLELLKYLTLLKNCLFSDVNVRIDCWIKQVNSKRRLNLKNFTIKTLIHNTYSSKTCNNIRKENLNLLKENILNKKAEMYLTTLEICSNRNFEV